MSLFYRVVARVSADVYAAQQVRSRCTRVVEFVVFPGIAQHLCLEAVNRRFTSVACSLLDDGPVNEFCERVMCILIRVPLSVRRLVVIQLLNGGVKPPRGHTGFCKQRERTQLASSHLLRTILHTVDGGFDGHPQYRGHVVRILISRNRANDKFLAAGFQSLEIPSQ